MIVNPFKDSEMILRIQQWNSKFTFDFLFRQKYKIPYGSVQHREMDFFDMKFDICEAKFMDYVVSVKKFGDEYEDQLLKIKEVDVEIADKLQQEEFDQLDLSDFDNL